MDIRRSIGWVLFVLGIVLSVGVVVAGIVALPRGLLGLAAAFQLALPGALAAALVLVGKRLAHPEPFESGPIGERPTPVPPVASAELDAVPEPVSACPDCGYLGIRMPTIGDGLAAGGGETGDRMVCPRCDWQGLPVRFSERRAYAAFTRELNGGAGA